MLDQMILSKLKQLLQIIYPTHMFFPDHHFPSINPSSTPIEKEVTNHIIADKHIMGHGF